MNFCFFLCVFVFQGYWEYLKPRLNNPSNIKTQKITAQKNNAKKPQMDGQYSIVQCHGNGYSCTCTDFCRNPAECLHLSLVKLFVNKPGNPPFKPRTIFTYKSKTIVELESNVLKGKKKKIFVVKGDTYRWTLVWINKVNYFSIFLCLCYVFCLRVKRRDAFGKAGRLCIKKQQKNNK